MSERMVIPTHFRILNETVAIRFISVAEDEGVYIYGEAAVDGIAREGEVYAEPLEGLDGDASAIIEGVDTAARSDGVCMIYGCGA